ncbi:MAG: GcvT family protein [Candidatus Puniceispirillaceae bacterium]
MSGATEKKALPKSARIVIIGGGVSGCSVAYHLTKLGWQDVVLLERKQLTSGTTWHAAGLIGQLRSSQNATRLAKYSADLYMNLEAETGVATGMRATGSLTVALTDARMEEITRQAEMAGVFDVEARPVSPEEAKAFYPYLNIDDVKGAVYLPADGQSDPANVAMALAKGARMRGALIQEGVKVDEVLIEDDKVVGVAWSDEAGDSGVIACDQIVNCGGMWARDLAAKSGVSLPLQACEHFYIVTEQIPDMQRLPVLRVPDECAYYKEDAGKILLGAFEPKAKPWAVEGIPEDFCFDQLPEDFDHFEPILAAAVERMPILETAGIHTFFNGPESFTPDDKHYLGQAPGVTGYWVAAGYNSIGIVSSGGAGFALAEWLDKGQPPYDLWEYDVRRVQPFQRNKSYLKERVSETLGLLYADHYPYRQMATSRGIRRTPLYHQLLAQGAVMSETAGWERPGWFANDGQERAYDYSWGPQNWFENARAEHMAVRENVGVFDLSSFGKIKVMGRDALAFLNRVCAAQIAIEPGRLVYTQMLNEHGGIESDLTVARLSATEFLLTVPAATIQRDLDWLQRHQMTDENLAIIDMTVSEAVIAVMGPKARHLLSAVSPHDFSNEAFAFGGVQEIEIGMGLARAHRVSYVGELGWEIYAPADQAGHIYEHISEIGADFGLRPCGMHVLDGCRMEKAFRHFGHDISDEDHIIDAGLGFAVAKDKTDFIGYDAVMQRRETGPQKRLLSFLAGDKSAMFYHNEPIYRDGKMAGYLTSGNYGHYLGGSVGMGYVDAAGQKPADILASSYQIQANGKMFDVTASLKPLYDPTHEKMKA